MPNLADRNECVGCTACVNVCPKQCIEMEKDLNGFAYPEVVHSLNCIECGMCEKSCPVLKESIVINEYPDAYAALSMDESIRMESSSGGVFTELAKRIISQSGVVYGASYDEHFGVCHYCVDNADDLYRLRGAKYAESNLGIIFQEILKRLQQGQLVLFSGTPCQVAGLKSFLRKDYDNLFCVDFVCHGVPSPMAWQSYIEYRVKEDATGELPCNINLRSKNTGWSRYQYSNVFKYRNGKQHSTLSSKSLFMKLFVGDYISRPSCEVCKFKGYSRSSDITLGDFWGIWDIYSEMDDNKGTSVVLVQSSKGKMLWEEIQNKIKYRQVTLEQASQYNPSMLVASKAKQNREEILERIRAGKIGSCEELFVQMTPSLSNRVKGKIGSMLHRILNK